eukprot:GHRQ01002753.1.p1 GENE.GHRQ01002753.1~~GHRQ01002753.1.p1  ORF type:complete len:217 (+),score=56.96 GHRQ01002753.1:276-926(+)
MQTLHQRSHGMMYSRPLHSCCAAVRPVLRQRRVHAAQKDTEISTKDWRAQRMVDKVHALFDRVWSKGDVQLVDDLITDDFVWKDVIWMSSKRIVGKKAFSSFVQQMREAYPDLHYEVGQVGVCDPVHVFVHWTCHGTNLRPTSDSKGRSHKPTFHESHISGIDFITFNDDRSKLQEIVIYRQPTLEEREFLEEEALEQERWSMIKLERLHYDGAPQ